MRGHRLDPGLCNPADPVDEPTSALDLKWQCQEARRSVRSLKVQLRWAITHENELRPPVSSM